MSMVNINAESSHRVLAPRPVYLIGSVSRDGTPNIIPVSNVTSVCTEPELVAVCIYKQWLTCKNLLAAEGWTISVPTFDQLEIIWKLGGRYSHYSEVAHETKADEFREILLSDFSSFGPVLNDSAAWLECRKIEALDRLGDHVLFVGEVLRAVADQDYYDSDGHVVGNLHIPMQWSGNVFSSCTDSMEIPYYGQE